MLEAIWRKVSAARDPTEKNRIRMRRIPESPSRKQAIWMGCPNERGRSLGVLTLMVGGLVGEEGRERKGAEEST
jgi:hypothetical protein